MVELQGSTIGICSMMKFEDLLTQSREQQSRRAALEEEVEELQERLNGELKLNSALRNAIRGPVLSSLCISPLLPMKAQMLLTELAMVEKEITFLETRLEKLKLGLYREKKLKREQKAVQNRLQMLSFSAPQNEGGIRELVSARPSLHNRRKTMEEGRLSLSCVSDMQTCSSARFTEETENGSLRVFDNKQGTDQHAEIDNGGPNKLSEELLKCLIRMFLNTKQKLSVAEGTAAASKHIPRTMSSKGLSAKTSFSCKAMNPFTSDDAITADPYDMITDFDSAVMDVGPYKNLVQIDRSSLKTSQLSESYPTNRKLRMLLKKLGYVDLTFLSHKQKLAFWINVYNACIMHAYLQHGLPPTQERMLTLLNKAAVNVGGVVLNALAIEHYLLRHPVDSKCDPTDEKEVLLRRAYGLRYPEPNITFALCRGNWSSPALMVYTPEEVVNQLSRAKVEYLEASVRVTSKRKVQVPKLLQWHMQDFADDVDSLIEWIYSQLPPNGSLRRAVMDCLKEDIKHPTGKMIEIVPYEYEFRYLLPHYCSTTHTSEEQLQELTFFTIGQAVKETNLKYS